MSSPRLRDPLKRPAFRRLALSYAVNELGDWLGIIALSVLVFELTDSALATALLFIGTGFLPALLTPLMVARLERPPPRFVLPTIYAAEAAAFGALALLAGHFSLAAVVAVATVDGALALTARTLTRAVTATMLEPEGELRAGNAMLNVAFTGGAAVGPGARRRRRRGARRAVGAAARRGLLLPDRLHPADRQAAAAARARAEARLLEQVRAGLGYIRRHADAAAPARRPGGGDRLLLRRHPDRGDLRQGDARRRRHRLRPAARQLGHRDGAGQRRLRRPCGAPRCRCCSSSARSRSAPATSAWRPPRPWPSPAPPRRSAAIGNGVQWVGVVSAVQELTVAGMQARVIGTLESVASAAPGIGYVLGGADRVGLERRARPSSSPAPA